MKVRFTAHLIDLTRDAALTSFWRKKALASFLTNSGIKDPPAWMPDESKRDYLSRLFEKLERTDRGKGMILRLANSLAEQTAFPDLTNWEDTAIKLAAAKTSIAALKSYLNQQESALREESNRATAQAKLREDQAVAARSRHTLDALSTSLNDLTARLGTSAAGGDFERWFYDLMNYSEISSRRPFHVDGREIDGSITITETTYLVECKFTNCPSEAPDIDVFRRKVDTKADNTMGLFISMSGFTSGAIKAASGPRTPLLLLDHGHLFHVLYGRMKFKDVVDRVRHHASQTGYAYLAVADFDG